MTFEVAFSRSGDLVALFSTPSCSGIDFSGRESGGGQAGVTAVPCPGKRKLCQGYFSASQILGADLLVHRSVLWNFLKKGPLLLVSLLRFVTGSVRPSAFVFTIYPSLFHRRSPVYTCDSCLAPLNTTFHLKLAPANGALSRRAVLLMFGLSGRSRGAIIGGQVLKCALLLWHLVFRPGSENEMETESEKGERTLTPHALELALRNYLKAENSA